MMVMIVIAATNMAARVHNHLALEDQVEVVRLLVLNDAHLHGLTIILVIDILRPQCRRTLLVLKKKGKHL